MKIVITDRQEIVETVSFIDTELYVVFDGSYAFPCEKWTDFTVPLFTEWINAFIYRDKNGFEWKFMDGDYRIRFTAQNDGTFDVICSGGGVCGRREYYKTTETAADIKNALKAAISDFVGILIGNKINNKHLLSDLTIKAGILDNHKI
jgi:hypothetical protein